MQNRQLQARSTRPFRGTPSNRLLADLPATELDCIRPQLDLVEIRRGSVLQDFGRAPEQVFFLESGLASLQVRTETDQPVEVGSVGRTGVIGAPMALGISHAPVRVVMQIPGEALAIRPADLRPLIVRSPTLRQLLLNNMQAVTMQCAQLVLCNARHEVAQRLARWLLLAQDQLGSDEIAITHAVIGSNLGIRRPSVTEVLSAFERTGMVRTERGCVAVTDRHRLEAVSCDCYRIISREHAKLAAPW